MVNKLIHKEIFEEYGFKFGTDKNGNQIAVESIDSEKEYFDVRNEIGISDLSQVKTYKFSGDEAFDFLDFIVSGDVGSIREDEMLHSFIMDNNAKIISDVYIANDNEEFILMADNGDNQKLDRIINEYSANFKVQWECLNDKYCLFSVLYVPPTPTTL